MLSPEELAELPERVRKLWLAFEEDALSDIAARIAANGGMVATAKWRTDKLKALGEQTQHLQKEISKRLKVSNDLVADIMKNAVYESLGNDEELLKEAYEKGLIEGYKANPETINPLLSKGVKLINSTIKHTALSYASKYNNVLSLALDKAHLNVEAGVLSIDEAVKQAVKDLADKGVGAYISSPSGRNERVNKVIERAVRTGVSKSILDAQYENLLHLGCDLVEVSSHIGARPSHALWQGEIYSISGKDKRYKPFKETTGYGQIDGLGGINCRHSFYPYFDGISTKSHRTFKLDENEEVYNLRQQYKNALNNAEKYRLRASIEKAGGLDNSKSRELAKKWGKTAQDLYHAMGIVDFNIPMSLDRNKEAYYINDINPKLFKVANDKFSISLGKSIMYQKNQIVHSEDKHNEITEQNVEIAKLSLKHPSEIYTDVKHKNTLNIVKFINEEVYITCVYVNEDKSKIKTVFIMENKRFKRNYIAGKNKRFTKVPWSSY